ncbi:MAG TPA: hypothetical protein P5299_00745 [Candidatus Woesebacteria bacterium]|nr:hypothetical protein [Candidatus Woesebacteria bacterium]HRT39877.1 hypothetical protein [Candidatus Woesebacteria bacterium]
MKKYYIYIILIIAFLLRIVGLNWDDYGHLHPDERFLTMVETSIQLPKSVREYFDTQISPLNPYNKGNSFFVYGTFPVFLTKIIGQLTGLTGYNQIHFVGRVLSALFDTLIVYFLYLLTKKKFLLPSLIYAFLVLPIQLSHFFTVDTFAVALIVICFWALLSDRVILSALFFGLALASKISLIPFFLIFILFWLIKYFKTQKSRIISNCLIFIFFSFLIFRLCQPYAFIGFCRVNPQFIKNLKELSLMSRDNSYFPPSVQWYSKTRLLFPLQNVVLWGVGIPFSLLFLYLLFKNRKKVRYFPLEIRLSLFWIIFLFAYQGGQFVHPMRYFLPIYPFIALVMGYLISQDKKSFFHFKWVFALNFIWVISFLSIYLRPNTRVEASDWIYQNIAVGTTLANEAWDDPLPLNRPQQSAAVYSGLILDLYDEDNDLKWAKIKTKLDQADYLIMSSNRLWGSIPKVAEHYPVTAQYYRDIFNQQTSWQPVVKFVSYPGLSWPLMKSCLYLGPSDYPGNFNSWYEVDKNCLHPGIYFRDDIADESFTVYDHAQVIIFTR